MPTYKIKAHRLSNHVAWLNAPDQITAWAKYLKGEWYREITEDQGLLKSSVHIEEEPDGRT